MNNRTITIFYLTIFLIPYFLLAACSDNSKFVHKSSEIKPWLGVQVKNISEKMLENMDIKGGIIVVKVLKNSPAEQGGLEDEDILLSFNGEELQNSDDLVDLVQDANIDEELEIEYIRARKKYKTKVKLGERKIFSRLPHRVIPHRSYIYDNEHVWLGVGTDELSDQLRTYFGVPEHLGVLVKEVIEESPAEKYGIKAGDIIINFGGKKIEDTRDLHRAIDFYEPEEEVEIKIIRNKKEQELRVVLGQKRGTKHFHYWGDNLNAYDLDIEIPEIDIEIPEFDLKELEKLEELEKDIKFKLEDSMSELNENLNSLQEKLKHIKIDVRKVKTHTI